MYYIIESVDSYLSTEQSQNSNIASTSRVMDLFAQISTTRTQFSDLFLYGTDQPYLTHGRSLGANHSWPVCALYAWASAILRVEPIDADSGWASSEIVIGPISHFVLWPSTQFTPWPTAFTSLWPVHILSVGYCGGCNVLAIPSLLYVMTQYSVHVLAHIIDFTLASAYLKCWLLWCICSGQHAGHDTTCHLAQPHLGSAKYWYLNITLALNMPYMDAFWAVFHLQNRHSENGRKLTLVAFQMHSVKVGGPTQHT